MYSLAKKVQEWWDDRRDKKITFVVGNEWEAGNLSYHLKDRPRWLSDEAISHIYTVSRNHILLCSEELVVHKSLLGRFFVMDKLVDKCFEYK